MEKPPERHFKSNNVYYRTHKLEEHKKKFARLFIYFIINKTKNIFCAFIKD